MYNKKVLSDALKNLDSAKAPAKKKDIVVNNNKLLPFVSSEGYKQGPPPAGTNYRIPGNSIYNPTPYPIIAKGSSGEEKFIAPGDTRTHTFEGSDYVDEYEAAFGGDISIPDLNQYEDGGEYELTDDEINQLRAGGYIIEDISSKEEGGFQDDINKRRQHLRDWTYGESIGMLQRKGGSLPNIPKKKNSKGYSRSLLATNPLFAQNPLLKKPKSKKKKIFDPNSKYYQKGGPFSSNGIEYPSWYKGQSLDAPIPDFTGGDPRLKQENKYNTIGEYFNALQTKSDTITQAPYKVLTYLGDPKNPKGHYDPEEGKYIYYQKGGGKEGYENVPAGQIDGEDYYNALTMANRNLQEVKVKPKSEQLGKGNWLKYQREFQSVTPYEEFAKERRERYLRRTPKGLNKLAGVTEENFPKAAETRIKQAYDRKLNTYVAKRIADDLGFDPSKRGEWVDIIMDPENTNLQIEKAREIFSKSDYQGKLQKPVGARFLSGLQQSANVFLPKSMEFNYDIEGYTPAENEIAKTDLAEPFEIFSPGEYYGAAAANALVTNPDIAGTEGGYRPNILSGEQRADVTPDMVSAFDPTNLLMFTNPAKVVTQGGKKIMGKLINKAAKYTKRSPVVDALSNTFIKQLGGQQYTYQGRPNAVYTKDDAGKWLIKTPDTGMKWQYIEDPKGERTKLLNKQAQPLSNASKVYQNQRMMEEVRAKAYANKLKNLRNEVKVYENELKYQPNYPISASESTNIDTGYLPREQSLTKQFNKSKSSAKAERIENIKAYLAQENLRQKEAAYKKTRMGMFDVAMQKQQEWENRSSGAAQPVDWFWTLPLAAAKAPKIISAIAEGSAWLDVPATIGGKEIAGLTAGNIIRGYGVGNAAMAMPKAFDQLERAETPDEIANAYMNLLGITV